MHATPDDLFRRLGELGIPVETHHHAPVFTVDEARALRGQLDGGHCKSLFLKDKKGALFLVVCLEDAGVDLKALRRKIGAAQLSFGKPELLMEILGVIPGSVTPFALMNDRERRVTVVLQSEMLALEQLNYHPLENDKTTQIASRDLLRFVKACGHDPVIVSIEPDVGD
ncbi:prolyl-tRNA synthetase associated domain-containing protein [Oceanibacterium hippocampi]|uniref:Prolyl-tRNA editing protein ProX n=1 Tax=Oceanibacterium hippocampi TaxID=745714 RepID=A0A1Y5RIY2_9PROT|nr:prolyl-tRNA synthetase associated domain-containing protein [Oceanibacterium hippocampi]SLN15950.1 Prolyl-tRNA editing protein ProX [Oceanibacterium hippocampi]